MLHYESRQTIFIICRKTFSQRFPVVFSILTCGSLFSSSVASNAETDSVSVSVMEGDSVTLNTGVQKNQQEYIKWYFKDIRIAQINGNLNKSCTDVQCNEGTERFRDRLKLDHQTGSLTILNTRTSDSGVYKLHIISSSSDSETTFSVAVHGESCLKDNYIKLQ